MNNKSLAASVVTGFTLALLCLFSNNLIADCDSTVPMHYPTNTDPNYQGSAHTDTFDCAINGTKQLTLEQVNERNTYLPPNLNNRFYVRIGANAAAEGIYGVSNIFANNTATGQYGTIQTGSNKVADNNFEMAFGYVWSKFALDFEWLASKSVSYSTAINNISPSSFTVNSDVKGDALLFNMYWIAKDFYNVKVYLDFMAGLSQNNSTSYITGGPTSTFNRTHWAFGLGFGGRFNIISRAYADICARYIYLGTARLVAQNGTEYVYLKVNRNWMGIGVCLLWLF